MNTEKHVYRLRKQLRLQWRKLFVKSIFVKAARWKDKLMRWIIIIRIQKWCQSWYDLDEQDVITQFCYVRLCKQLFSSRCQVSMSWLIVTMCFLFVSDDTFLYSNLFPIYVVIRIYCSVSANRNIENRTKFYLLY